MSRVNNFYGVYRGAIVLTPYSAVEPSPARRPSTHHRQSSATKANVPISDRHMVPKTGNSDTTTPKISAPGADTAKRSWRTGTIVGILFIFLLSIILLVFLISSDVRTGRQPLSPLVSFQQGQDTRSTLDIIYSCLSTMILSSISAIHFNTPSKERSNEGGFVSPPSDKWEKAQFYVIYWIFGLLMPEIIVFIACKEYQRALIDLESVGDESPGWTLKHSFFVKMGGFHVNDLVVKNGEKIAKFRWLKNRFEDLGRDITKKSKEDILSKCIAVVKIGQFLLSMIARAADSLPISPLEYFTCAQVVCALLMYAFWFEKPHNVQEPIRIKSESFKSTLHQGAVQVDTSIDLKPSWSMVRFLVTGYAAAIVGASALGQWNAHFPTPTWQKLWRIFSIFSAILPLLTIIVAWDYREHQNPGRTAKDTILRVFLILHCLNRLVLVGLVFTSFSKLPADVYKTVKWLDFVSFI